MSPTPEQLNLRMGWVNALRSGKYKQGHGCLRQGDRFCCLGVACDLAQEWAGVAWTPRENDYFDFGGMGGELPKIVQDIYGVDSDLFIRSAGQSVSALNDGDTPFPEMADLIEAEYILPFVEMR